MKRKRKQPGGTAVERARAKIAESRFFIDEMVRNQHRGREFGYCLSAFLSAFKSIEYQLSQPAIKALRDSDKEIDFLMDQRNFEVHQAGVRIVLVADLMRIVTRVERFRSRFEPEPHRFHKSRLTPSIRVSSDVRSWRFTDKRSVNLIGYCTDCVNKVEKFVDGLKNASEVADNKAASDAGVTRRDTGFVTQDDLCFPQLGKWLKN